MFGFSWGTNRAVVLSDEDLEDGEDDSGPHSFLETNESANPPTPVSQKFSLKPPTLVVQPKSNEMAADETTLQKILTSLKALETAVNKQASNFGEFRAKEFGDVKNKLEKNIAAHDQRLLVVDNAQEKTDGKVSVLEDGMKKLQEGHAASCKHMADFHARLRSVEMFQEQQRQQQATPQTAAVVVPEQKEWKAKEYKDFLLSEMNRIKGYERENALHQNVVLVGPKPKREPCTQLDIEQYLKKDGVPQSAYQIFQRGKNGV